MSLIGTTDAAAFTQSVGVVNGDATVTKNAADTVVGGDVLEISGVNYIVKTVTSGTSIELHKVYAGATATVANTAVIKRTPPKHVAEFVIVGGDSNSYELIFADSTEGSLAESKSRGIKNPGWWLYRTYTDHYGNTRHKAECIAAMSVAAGTSGDMADDTIAADVASSVAIGTQPASSTSSSGAGTFANLATTTTGTPGTLAYVWQRQTASGKRWQNITASLDTGITYANFTTATLAYSGLGGATLDGQNYRVKITSANGTEEVISNGAGTLTFGS